MPIVGCRRQTSAERQDGKPLALPSAQRAISERELIASAIEMISGNMTKGVIPGLRRRTSAEQQDVEPPALSSGLRAISERELMTASVIEMISGNMTREAIP